MSTTTKNKPAAKTSHGVKQDPQSPRRWYVTTPAGKFIREDDNAKQVRAFPTKAAAQAHAAALNEQAELDAEPSKVTTTSEVQTTPVEVVRVSGGREDEPASDEPDYGTMSASDRIAAAGPERDALRAWKDGGREGDRPATPVIDWMTLNGNRSTSAPKAPREKGTATTRTAEQQARLVAILNEVNGQWHKAAKMLTAEGIPTSRGGGWYYSTVAGLAKQLRIEVTTTGGGS